MDHPGQFEKWGDQWNNKLLDTHTTPGQSTRLQQGTKSLGSRQTLYGCLQKANNSNNDNKNNNNNDNNNSRNNNNNSDNNNNNKDPQQQEE